MMRKGEVKIKAIEKIIMLLAILITLAIVNGKIYELIGTQVMSVLWNALRWAMFLSAVFLIVKQVIVIYVSLYSKKSEQVWGDIKERARSKILSHLMHNRNSMPMLLLMQLAVIYEDDEEVFCRVLDEIIGIYRNGNIDEKSIISFFRSEERRVGKEC